MITDKERRQIQNRLDRLKSRLITDSEELSSLLDQVKGVKYEIFKTDNNTDCIELVEFNDGERGTVFGTRR